MTKITQLSIMTGKEAYGDDFHPFKYEGFGELISTYLNIQKYSEYKFYNQKPDLELLSGIYNINNTEELWNLPDGMFTTIMETSDASISDLSIGYLGFGTININGIKLPAVMEQNASPIIIHISTRSKRILMNIFKGKIEFNE